MPDPAGTDAVVVANWEQEAPRMAQALGSIRVPPVRLTPAQVEQFDADGFLLPLPAVSEQEAAAVRAKIEAAEEASQQGGNGLFTNAHTLYDWFAELATCDAVLDVVQDLIGPDIMIWKSQLWIKESESGSYVGWHQVRSLNSNENPCRCRPPRLSRDSPRRLLTPGGVWHRTRGTGD